MTVKNQNQSSTPTHLLFMFIFYTFFPRRFSGCDIRTTFFSISISPSIFRFFPTVALLLSSHPLPMTGSLHPSSGAPAVGLPTQENSESSGGVVLIFFAYVKYLYFHPHRFAFFQRIVQNQNSCEKLWMLFSTVIAFFSRSSNVFIPNQNTPCSGYFKSVGLFFSLWNQDVFCRLALRNMIGSVFFPRIGLGAKEHTAPMFQYFTTYLLRRNFIQSSLMSSLMWPPPFFK